MIGCSDWMMGGGELRNSSWVLGQNWSMMTPWGMYMNARRTGGLVEGVPAAQARESRNGSARETPTPFRKVRRSTMEG